MALRWIYNKQIVNGLANLRREWQEAANGESLAEVKGSVGLLLDDVCDSIGLDGEERDHVLGVLPQSEIETLLERR